MAETIQGTPTQSYGPVPPIAPPVTQSYGPVPPLDAPQTATTVGPSPTTTTTSPDGTVVSSPSPAQMAADASFRSSLNTAVNSSTPMPASMLGSNSTTSGVLSSADKMYQDYFKKQSDIQTQMLSNLTPSAAEINAKLTLNKQKEQAALDEERALNSGETSAFAGGEAQRVNRTNAIRTAALEATVQTFQDARKAAVEGLTALSNSGDRSISNLIEIQKLRNTVSDIDKQAESTFFNLQEKNPGIAVQYDRTKSAVDNLEVLRGEIAKKAATSKNFQSDPDVGGLFRLGLITGGTEEERTARANQLAGLPADQKALQVFALARSSLPTSKQDALDKNDVGIGIANQALANFDSDMVNNPYKYLSNQYIGYLGGKKDPKYTNFLQLVESVNAPVRQSYFGASLTTGEQEKANSFLPDTKKDDIKTLVMKLQNVQAIAQYTNDVVIANVLGKPKPKIEGYMPVKSDGSPRYKGKEGYVDTPDEAAKSWGYTPEEIKAFQSRGGSFDKVGNTSASITIPQSSRLSYVNNNPTNLKFAGQTGAVEGEGGFARFSTPEAGIQAFKNQAKLDSSRGHTLETFIMKYAPKSENNTEEYITQATKSLGLDRHTPLSGVDLEALTRFIANKESSTRLS